MKFITKYHDRRGKNALYIYGVFQPTRLVHVFQDVHATAHVYHADVVRRVGVGPGVETEPLAAVFRRLTSPIFVTAAVEGSLVNLADLYWIWSFLGKFDQNSVANPVQWQDLVLSTIALQMSAHQS